MTVRTTGDTDLAALVIASHFRPASAVPIIPLLTLLKMTKQNLKQNFSLRTRKVVLFMP